MLQFADLFHVTTQRLEDGKSVMHVHSVADSAVITIPSVDHAAEFARVLIAWIVFEARMRGVMEGTGIVLTAARELVNREESRHGVLANLDRR